MASITCPHLYSLDPNITVQLLHQKEKLGSCSRCQEDPSGSLWLCVSAGCLSVLCDNSSVNHSMEHHILQPAHMLVLNLSNYRVWCYICQMEVTYPMRRYLRLNLPLQDEHPNETPEMEEAVIEVAEEEQQEVDLYGEKDLYGLDYEQEEPRGIVGLRNLGLTCYMNAALQVLSNSPGVPSFFSDCKGSLEGVRAKTNPSLAKSFMDLVGQLQSRSSSGNYVSPTILSQTFRQLYPMFRMYTQQDSQEFLRYFLDELHDELKQPLPLVAEDTDTEATDDDEQMASDSDELCSTSSFLEQDDRDTDEVDYETCDSGVSGGGSSSSNSTLRRPSSDHKNQVEPPPEANSPSPSSSPRQNSFISRTSGYASLQHSSRENLQNTNSNKKSKMKRSTKTKKTSPTEEFSGSVVSDLFDGRLVSSVQCLTCNTISTRHETFQDLSLPIPSSEDRQSNSVVPGSWIAQQTPPVGWVSWMWQWLTSWVWGPSVSLLHCLAAFFSADELKGDNMYSCEKCGKLRNGLKYSQLVKLPEVLMIHLKRFRHDYMFSSKISQHVAFPLTGLNLEPFFLHRDCVSQVRQYSLYGVIVHHGSVGGGHYTSFAKNPDTGHWFEFDDECVTPVSEDTVQKSQAYVLFYKKENPEAVVHRNRMKNIMKVAQRKRSLVRFYISKQWYNKFETFAECGPVDNSDFLCPHGGVQPRKLQYVKSLVKVVRESVWEYFKYVYGGGPPCTRLFPCHVCNLQLQALLHRQQTELLSYKMLNSKSMRVYGVPMSWFNLWENFVLDRTQIPPPKIDNSAILKQHQGSPSTSQYFRSRSLDYVTVTRDCWRFFQATYDGGPEFCLQPGYVTPSISEDPRQKEDLSDTEKKIVSPEDVQIETNEENCETEERYSSANKEEPLVHVEEQEMDENEDNDLEKGYQQVVVEEQELAKEEEGTEKYQEIEDVEMEVNAEEDETKNLPPISDSQNTDVLVTFEDDVMMNQDDVTMNQDDITMNHSADDNESQEAQLMMSNELQIPSNPDDVMTSLKDENMTSFKDENITSSPPDDCAPVHQQNSSAKNKKSSSSKKKNKNKKKSRSVSGRR